MTPNTESWRRTVPSNVSEYLFGNPETGEPGAAAGVTFRLLEVAGYQTRKRFSDPDVLAALVDAAAQALFNTVNSLEEFRGDSTRTLESLKVLEHWLASDALVGELSQIVDPRANLALDYSGLTRAYAGPAEQQSNGTSDSLMQAAIARCVAEFYVAMVRRPVLYEALDPELLVSLAQQAQQQAVELSEEVASVGDGQPELEPELVNGDLADGKTVASEGSAVAQGGLAISGNVLGHVIQVYHAPAGHSHLSDEDVERILTEYLTWVRNAYDKARLYGLESAPVARPAAIQKLTDVFIAVALRRHKPPSRHEVEKAMRGLGGVDALLAWHQLSQSKERAGRTVAIQELLTISDRVALVGGAGTGKSTVLAYIAACLAEAAQTGGALPFDLPDDKPLIPLVVPLRYYRDYLERTSQSPDTPIDDPRRGTLAGFIPWFLRRRNPALEFSEDFFDRLLRGGACLLMIDGLDEIANRDQRGQVRQELENLVNDVYPGNHILVTAREAGYRDEAVFGDDFLRLDFQPLSPALIDDLVHKWCQRLFPESVDQSRQKLVSAIAEINELRRERNLPPLISTPLMATMVISVQWGETDLPRERARLYEACVKAIIQAQYVPDDPARHELINWGGPWETQRIWLSGLALAMHKGGRASAAVREEQVRAILARSVEREAIDTFLTAVRSRGGIFEERAEFFQFIHLTFQEFLAARLLAKQRDASHRDLQPFITNSWWREVFLLIYGFLQMDHPPAALEYLNWLVRLNGKADGNERLAGAEIAGAAVLEIERPDDELRTRHSQILADMLQNPELTLEPGLRAVAGRTLGQLGDPRPGVGVSAMGVPDIAWCEVALSSIGRAIKGMITGRVKPFAISKYPVTVAQFRAFAADGGYGNRWRNCWSEEGWRWKGDSPGPIIMNSNDHPDNHPMVMVTWYEAEAFCRWLGQKLGRLVALPTDEQWRLAATAGSDLHYPWGSEQPTFDHANWRETEIGVATAVGLFPRGVNSLGVMDLAGNVWEWCSQETKGARSADANGAGTQPAALVVRGGSYMDGIESLRCAHKLQSVPGYRDWDCGFRIVDLGPRLS